MKTLITDLDGTILNNGKMTNFTINKLKEFQLNNRLILATGRTLHATDKIYKELDMEKYNTGCVIFLNGLGYYDFNKGKYYINKSFTETQIKYITFILYLCLHRITYVTEDHRYEYPSLYDRLYNFYRKIFKGSGREFKTLSIPDNVLKLEISGTIFRQFFMKLIKVFLFRYEVVFVNEYWIEILPKGTNKLNMIKEIMKEYDIDDNDVYVFGDGENDVAMLQHFKHSYAPSHAMTCAKDAASEVFDNDDYNGVVNIIQGDY